MRAPSGGGLTEPYTPSPRRPIRCWRGGVNLNLSFAPVHEKVYLRYERGYYSGIEKSNSRGKVSLAAVVPSGWRVAPGCG